MEVAVTNIPLEFDRYVHSSELLEASQDAALLGYPSPQERWHISASEWDAMAETGVITVPDGAWVVSNHPARERNRGLGKALDPANSDEINPSRKATWRAGYALVTDRGLPVHPMARLGVTTEIWDEKTHRLHKLGMATGIGRERRCGALNTGALLLARLGQAGEIEYPVATELRNKRRRRAFLGGYGEQGEAIADICIRESDEEGCLVTACAAAHIPWNEIEALPHVLWKLSPSVTGPCTLNAWLAEHFLAIDATSVPDMQNVILHNGEPDKIERVEWSPARELLGDKTFLGAHRRALRAHLKAIALP